MYTVLQKLFCITWGTRGMPENWYRILDIAVHQYHKLRLFSHYCLLDMHKRCIWYRFLGKSAALCFTAKYYIECMIIATLLKIDILQSCLKVCRYVLGWTVLAYWGPKAGIVRTVLNDLMLLTIPWRKRWCDHWLYKYYPWCLSDIFHAKDLFTIQSMGTISTNTLSIRIWLVILSWCWWNFLTSANLIAQIGSCDRSRIHVPDLGGTGVWPGKKWLS